MRNENEVLLHMCCAPCAEFPYQQLIEEGFTMEGFFFNPNIQPEAELQRRLDSVHIFAEKYDLLVHEDQRCDEEVWRNFPSNLKVHHCNYCYSLRMNETAKKAKELGFKYFTSALFVSPWQDHEGLKKAAEHAASKYGVEFLYRDFRPGYRQGQEMAKADGLYRQRYCGCIYSLGETKFTMKISKELGVSLEDIPTRIVS